MRKILFLSMLIATIQQSNAQITILRTDFGFVGDTLVHSQDTTFVPGQTHVGPAGVNKTWNFAGLVSADTTGKTIIYSPVNDPNAPLGCNMAVSSITEGIQYFLEDTLAIRIMREDPLGSVHALRILEFPSTYNSVIMDSTKIELRVPGSTFGMPQFDSLLIVGSGVYNIVCDAWGKLVTPEDTFEVLRKKEQITESIDLYGKLSPPLDTAWIPVQHQVTKSYYYIYLAKNQHFYVARAQTDSAGYIQRFTYLHSGGPGVYAGEASAPAYTYYPNPANTEVTIELPQFSTAVSVELHDLSGKRVLHETAKGGVVRLRVDALDAGLYCLTVDGQHPHKLVVTR